ncbi:ubiquitin carboxyl-terminal hydrolase 45-like isoform X2 [Dreissena polymorpha]|uniref:ubiquitin carboxyl-terminal hydrolase 45-like isoform X2 n=1 Tax=Dreissena polymorpha TaxID=45954 RepID=UPI002264F244|nr:ubiquitin carboxyl-terminal hydrolase 45-like isoform X2 [Dreissena polymorpha]
MFDFRCYDCDCEIPASKSKKVAECLEYLQKQVASLTGESAQGRAGSSNNQPGNGGVLDTNKSRALITGRPPMGGGCSKVKGLSNLGNTCFFNAVMQNLVQTHSLEWLLHERRKGTCQVLTAHLDTSPDTSDEEGEKHGQHASKELGGIEITLGEAGALTNSLVVFLQEVNSTSKSGCINPSGLFSQICKKASRFRGMQQQDSQELLRYLLDNMKTEEIKRGQAGILKHFKLSEHTKPKCVDEETKYKVKTYGQEAKHTFVDCLFGGQLISTVICEECKYISQILEPFLDLSLPVMEEKPQRPNMSHKGVSKESDPGDLDLVKPPVAKEDVGPSKHMSKKAKKNKKRDARRHSGHGKGKGAGGSNKEGEEEKGEEPGKEGEEHQEEDSDADIEDNLESDTSKCYTKSASDSISPDEQGTGQLPHEQGNGQLPQKSEQGTGQHEQDMGLQSHKDEQGTGQLPHNSNNDTELQGNRLLPLQTQNHKLETMPHNNTDRMQETSHKNGQGTKASRVDKRDLMQGTNNENHEESDESIDVISDDSEAGIDAGLVMGQLDSTCSRTLSGYSSLHVASSNGLPENTQQKQLSFMSSNIADCKNGFSCANKECIKNEAGTHVTNHNCNVTDSKCLSSSSMIVENSSSKPTGISCVANIEETDTISEEYVVNYTFSNGQLSETTESGQLKSQSSIETSYTFHCGQVGDSGAEVETGKRLGNGENLFGAGKVEGSKVCASPMMNGDLGLVNGELENGEVLSEGESITCRGQGVGETEMGDSVGSSTLELHTEASSDISTLTSDVSAISITDLPDIVIRGSDSVDVTVDIGVTPADDDVLSNELSNLSLKLERLDSDGKMSPRTLDEDRLACGGVNKGGNCVTGGQHRERDGHNGQSRSGGNVSKQLDLKQLYQEGKKKSVNSLAERYHVSSGECSIQSCLNQFTAAELLTGHNKFGCKNCTKLKFGNKNSKSNQKKEETVYSNANKQYLIFQTPAVLTLHLKRFEQVGFSSRKVNRHVDFPFLLDIAPYCSHVTQGIKTGQKKVLYSLYGVVEHSGRLNAGHYTAYVKVRPNIGTLNNFLNKHNVSLKEYLSKYAEMVRNGAEQEEDVGASINTEALVPPGRWYHISDARVNEVTEATVERAQAYLLFYERIY